tara:strand:+ start:68 stop:646 length:579 start_codon:yes stop_codon:yes gene_type:complete
MNTLAEMTTRTPAELYRKEYIKKYAKEHPEATMKSKKKWREANREYSRNYAKKYYAENKANYKTKYEENKEDLSKKARDYHKTEKGKRLHTISYWKRRKIIHDDYNQLYKDWIASTVCNKCDMPYVERSEGGGSYKCIAKQFGTDNFDSICCFKCMNREKVLAKNKLYLSALDICIKPSKTPSVTKPLQNEN